MVNQTAMAWKKLRFKNINWNPIKYLRRISQEVEPKINLVRFSKFDITEFSLSHLARRKLFIKIQQNPSESCLICGLFYQIYIDSY